MTIIEIAALPNRAHKNQTWYDEAIPEGWALIPEDMTIPASFPFVDLVVEEITYYRDVEQMQDVIKTREVERYEEVKSTVEVPETDTYGNVVLGEDGNPVTTTQEVVHWEPYIATEEYTEQEMVIVQEPYTRMEVTEMTELVMPEPKPGIFDQPSSGTGLTDAAMAAAILEGVESV